MHFKFSKTDDEQAKIFLFFLSAGSTPKFLHNQSVCCHQMKELHQHGSLAEPPYFWATAALSVQKQYNQWRWWWFRIKWTIQTTTRRMWSLSIGLVTQVTKQSERLFYAVFLFCKNLPGGQIGPVKKTYKAQKPFKVKDIKMCLI